MYWFAKPRLWKRSIGSNPISSAKSIGDIIGDVSLVEKSLIVIQLSWVRFPYVTPFKRRQTNEK